MPYTPKDSPIKLTPEQEAEINSCSPEQVVPLLHLFMQQNGNARINADGEAEVVIGPIPRRLAQTVELNGQKHFVEVDASEVELGLQKAVVEFYRTHQNGSQQTPPKRDASGKFVAEAAAAPMPADEQELTVAVADLRGQVIRGEILPEEFLSKKQELESGLRESRDWQSAVEAFKVSDAGSDWVGGDKNRDLLVSMIQHLDLMTGEEVDSTEKKVAVLAGLWNQMKRTGHFYEPEVSPAELAEKLANEAVQEQANIEYEAEIAKCRTATEIAEVNTRFGYRTERTSSGLFDR